MPASQALVRRLRSALAILLALVTLTLFTEARAEKIASVLEFYYATLDHYFITADPVEVENIDVGGLGPAWSRTGSGFQAWDANDGPANSVQVCRFFGTDRYRADGTRIGPNGHFYTADPAECEFVRTAWQSLANDGLMYPAWTFESYAFRVIPPVSGACPAGTIPLYRAYNNGARGDPNHRYSTDLVLLQSMAGWTVEGVVMCLPGVSLASSPNSGACMIPVPGHSSVLQDSALGVTQQQAVTGETTAPVVHVTAEMPGGKVEDERRYNILPGPGERKRMRFGQDKSTLTGPSVTIATEIDDGQELTLPMEPGETQFGYRAVSGGVAISAPGFSCTQPITGNIAWQWTYVGIETVTVPAGTFAACRFRYYRAERLSTVCPGRPVTGGGAAGDWVTYWFVPDIGVVKSEGLVMISHTP